MVQLLAVGYNKTTIVKLSARKAEKANNKKKKKKKKSAFCSGYMDIDFVASPTMKERSLDFADRHVPRNFKSTACRVRFEANKDCFEDEKALGELNDICVDVTKEYISAVEKAGIGTLAEGQKISYELQPGQNGKSSAENLAVIE